MGYRWPLSDSNFTWLDRLKICKFFLNPKNQWTAGKLVQEYENAWAAYTGSKYVVMTGSGSASNTLIAAYTRTQNKERNIIVTSPVGWMTTYSPWLKEGFQLKFIDINLRNLSINVDKLRAYLINNHQKVACIFIPSILGFSPDLFELRDLGKKYNIDIKLDNCESSNNFYGDKSINNYFTSSTSLFFSHIHTTGAESGLIFTNNKEEYKYYLMARAHGLTRSLIPYVKDTNKSYEDGIGANELIWEDVKNIQNKELRDHRFDFNLLGNNYRSSDIYAFIGSLDFKRRAYYNQRRRDLYFEFSSGIDPTKFLIIQRGAGDVPFAIPIILKQTYGDLQKRLDSCFKVCDDLGIEYRLLVSGNILRSTAFKHLERHPEKFEYTERIHNGAFYVGLNPRLKNWQVRELTEELNLI